MVAVFVLDKERERPSSGVENDPQGSGTRPGGCNEIWTRPYTYCISRRNFFGSKQLRVLVEKAV
jgi:hypothetical protein